jgi:hypothetical protein
VTFLYDREGRIDRLLAALEPNVDDIVFRRGASGEALDAAFRQACVGVYRGGAVVHMVAIDADGELTLSPTGQPTYRLAPYRECVFAIRELEGYRVEFVPDESGPVTKIIFHQPTERSRRSGRRNEGAAVDLLSPAAEASITK